MPGSCKPDRRVDIWGMLITCLDSSFGCWRDAAERGMIFGTFDVLDSFLHGTDTSVVEFATGILAPLDLGVEAGNQLPQCRDLRFGGALSYG